MHYLIFIVFFRNKKNELYKIILKLFKIIKRYINKELR